MNRPGQTRHCRLPRQGVFLARFHNETALALEHFLFENALLTRKRQPPQRGVHSGENRVFRL
ncbi:hypothetical protein, partial [Desulfovibrio sp. ZJ200]|uniref:hypothetical protein n=1 Tax=Desulfovibrio sp. ZJ200 TaxID=2709792 RepID=UPI0013ED93CE